jgi:hypothetical protein
MRRSILHFTALVLLIGAGSARGGVVESYESGVGNVTVDVSEGSPTVESSTLFPTEGAQSAKFTMTSDWAWRWNTHNVLPSVADVIANQYLVFDVTVPTGQIKLAGIAANSQTTTWKQQDAWSDALTQPGGAGQLLQLPTFVTGENRGYGTLATGATATYIWDYKAAGFTPGLADTYVQFALNFQGPTGSVVHVDNLRVTGAPPQPPQFVETKLYSWETPDVVGTPVNEQFEGWTQGSPGFGENTHLHSISTLGATEGTSSLQVDRTATATGFTWGSQVRINGADSPEAAAQVADWISKINNATAIRFDVRFDDSYPNTPTFTKFGMYVSDGTSFFDGEGASINGVLPIGSTRTVTIPFSSLDTSGGVNLEDAGLAVGAAGIGFGISVNTTGGGLYQIDNLRLVTEVPPLTADFNGDGSVDSDDLTEWKTAFGLPPDAGGDADGDGDSDGADFLAWQRELGSGAGASATVAAIPEPTAGVLALSALALAGFRRRL